MADSATTFTLKVSIDYMYDRLMALIEPELMSTEIPKLKERYRHETPQAAAERKQRYDAAFVQYEAAIAELTNNLRNRSNDHKTEAEASLQTSPVAEQHAPEVFDVPAAPAANAPVEEVQVIDQSQQAPVPQPAPTAEPQVPPAPADVQPAAPQQPAPQNNIGVWDTQPTADPTPAPAAPAPQQLIDDNPYSSLPQELIEPIRPAQPAAPVQEIPQAPAPQTPAPAPQQPAPPTQQATSDVPPWLQQ